MSRHPFVRFIPAIGRCRGVGRGYARPGPDVARLSPVQGAAALGHPFQSRRRWLRVLWPAARAAEQCSRGWLYVEPDGPIVSSVEGADVG